MIYNRMITVQIDPRVEFPDVAVIALTYLSMWGNAEGLPGEPLLFPNLGLDSIT